MSYSFGDGMIGCHSGWLEIHGPDTLAHDIASHLKRRLVPTLKKNHATFYASRANMFGFELEGDASLNTSASQCSRISVGLISDGKQAVVEVGSIVQVHIKQS